MKFGRYLDSHRRDIWAEHYLDYKQLKTTLSEVLADDEAMMSLGMLSLSTRGPDRPDGPRANSPEFRFGRQLEEQVQRINAFTQATAAKQRASLRDLSARIKHADLSDPEMQQQLLAQAREIGQEYLFLEKFVNLNYAALQKILKKHDKMMPHAPCWHIYKVHISQQPWVRGDHHDIQLTLSRMMTTLHSALLRSAADPSLPEASRNNSTDASFSSSHGSVGRGAEASGSLGASGSFGAGSSGSSLPVGGGGESGNGLAKKGSNRMLRRGSSGTGGGSEQLQRAAEAEAAAAGVAAVAAGLRTLDHGPLSHREQYSQKFWVRLEDVAEISHTILQHLPVHRLKNPEPMPRPAEWPASTGNSFQGLPKPSSSFVKVARSAQSAIIAGGFRKAAGLPPANDIHTLRQRLTEDMESGGGGSRSNAGAKAGGGSSSRGRISTGGAAAGGSSTVADLGSSSGRMSDAGGNSSGGARGFGLAGKSSFRGVSGNKKGALAGAVQGVSFSTDITPTPASGTDESSLTAVLPASLLLVSPFLQAVDFTTGGSSGTAGSSGGSSALLPPSVRRPAFRSKQEANELAEVVVTDGNGLQVVPANTRVRSPAGTGSSSRNSSSGERSPTDGDGEISQFTKARHARRAEEAAAAAAARREAQLREENEQAEGEQMEDEQSDGEVEGEEDEDEDELTDDSWGGRFTNLYLDNTALELYHNLLYGRPYATSLKVQWRGTKPEGLVQIVRLVYKEGWRFEASVDDRFSIQEGKVAQYLAGTWTWADARKHLLSGGGGNGGDGPPGGSGRSSASGFSNRSSLTGQLGAFNSVTGPGGYNSGYNSRRGGATGQGGFGVHGGNRRGSVTGQGPGGYTATGPGSGGALGGRGSISSSNIERQGSGMNSLVAAGKMRSHSGQAIAEEAEEAEQLAQLTAAEQAAKVTQEYKLFKTFTEIQRLVESKQLQPMARVCFSRTEFQSPFDPRLRLQLEFDIQMFLEFSYDAADRIAAGMWRQQRPADSIQLPYAVLRVHMLHDESSQSAAGVAPPQPEWLQELLSRPGIMQVDDFSKYLHACAGMLPDMVRAVPHWIDDPLVQATFFQNVAANQQLQAYHLSGHDVIEELEAIEEAEGSGAEENPRRALLKARTLAQLATNPLLGQSSLQELADGLSARRNPLQTITSQTGLAISQIPEASSTTTTAATGALKAAGRRSSSSAAAAMAAAEKAGNGGGLPEGEPLLGAAGTNLLGWQLKLLHRRSTAAQAYRPHSIFSSPHNAARNERILLTALSASILAGAIAALLLGFSAQAVKDTGQDPIIMISEVTAFGLLAMAIALASYGLAAYLWRKNQFESDWVRHSKVDANAVIAGWHLGRYDDTRGTLLLAWFVAGSLTLLLAANLADLYELLLIDKAAGS